MMPPTKLPHGHHGSDHRWPTASLVTTRSKPPDPQSTAPARPLLDGLARPSTRPQPHPGRAGRPLRPCQLAATALSTDLQSP
jgi:hypothetical protein